MGSATVAIAGLTRFPHAQLRAVSAVQTNARLRLQYVVLMEYSTFMGFDVHLDQITAAKATLGGGDPEVLGRIANTPQAVAKLVRKKLGDRRDSE